MTLSQVPRELAERLTLDVAELPDRTSPDDWPDAMLVTDAELREMAEAAIREAMRLALESRWIPMGERLPEPNPHNAGHSIEILLWDKHLSRVAQTRLWYNNINGFTHWMPLPEPPSTTASSLTEQESKP